eukprot:3369187-Alexandrium_andersonii.AAC.1
MAAASRGQAGAGSGGDMAAGTGHGHAYEGGRLGTLPRGVAGGPAVPRAGWTAEGRPGALGGARKTRNALGLRAAAFQIHDIGQQHPEWRGGVQHP